MWDELFELRFLPFPRHKNLIRLYSFFCKQDGLNSARKLLIKLYPPSKWMFLSRYKRKLGILNLVNSRKYYILLSKFKSALLSISKKDPIKWKFSNIPAEDSEHKIKNEEGTNNYKWDKENPRPLSTNCIVHLSHIFHYFDFSL